VRKSDIEKIKLNAPELPYNTCPYIDFIQEILKEAIDQTDSILVEKKLELADSILEYVRESNDSLRQSSMYWYQKFNSKK
jgi:hypothetical protein